MKRTLTLHLLRLIKKLSDKTLELDKSGIQFMAADELIEQVANTLFEINSVHPEHTGTLYLSLSDYTSGAISEADFMGLLQMEWR